ncbi:MAG: hypothetical protein IJL76_00400 [Bacilli bacterium]|nr:hypothetical protein [Bacilli bacterium]
MVKWLNNIISTMVFFLVYMIVYYLFAREVNASVLVTSIIFFILVVIYDLNVYKD